MQSERYVRRAHSATPDGRVEFAAHRDVSLAMPKLTGPRRALVGKGYNAKILRAAATLESPFHIADLVVAAWRLHPETFGLRGHDQPHSARVMAHVAGKKGLVGLGYLERLGSGMYRLTLEGKRAIRAHKQGNVYRPGKPRRIAAKVSPPAGG